ncbi:hypothetical protein B7Y94_01440 [Candidatus Saccharibacteria bacterium 32-49-12]|nr:MAG: hypothetical protein B7Y94_01440 [Candidatus Saccharibacteria bacterium 32-49-12]
MKPLTPSTPHLIVMVGIPGAGKTHFAEHFSKMFAAPYVNQTAIQTMAGIDESRATELSTLILDEMLKTGRTIVFEGPTHRRTFRMDLAKKARAAGYSPMLVWVQTDPVQAKQRTIKKWKVDPVEYDNFLKQFSRPHQTERPVVISGKHTYASQVKIVLKRLAGNSRTDETNSPKPDRPSSPANARRLIIR